MPTGLLDLSEDLILIILEYVHDSSPHTSHSVAQVNKCLYRIIYEIHNRQKTLNIQYLERLTGSQNNKDNWTQNSTVLQSIRHLTIVDNPGSGQQSDVNVERICNLINRIENLKTLTWNVGPVPVSVLELLEQKSIRLRVFNYWRKNVGLHYLTEDELALSLFKHLTHFRAAVVLGNTNLPESCMHTYKKMIANSQSLQYAGIFDAIRQVYTSRPLTGQSDNDVPITEVKRCESIKNFTLDCRWFTLSKDLLEDLSTYVDISRLETLKFVRGQQQEPDYFRCAASMLPNIKHVSLNFATMGHRPSVELLSAANEYLLECPPLTSLSLWEAIEVVNMDELINHHSSTIEALQVHQKWLSSDQEMSPRQILPARTIALIREKCSKLRDLTLDLNRTDGSRRQQRFNLFLINCSDNNLAMLDELKLFGSRLSRLQIYFEGIIEDFTFPAPAVTDGAKADPNEDDTTDQDSEGSDEEDIDAGTTNADGEGEHEDDSDDEDDEDDEDDDDDDGDLEDSSDDEPLTRPVPPPLDWQTIVDRRLAWEGLMQNFAEDIWRRVFGEQDFGERGVDVKFGEWEAKQSHYFSGNRRCFEVRPHERDDRAGECFTKMMKSRM